MSGISECECLYCKDKYTRDAQDNWKCQGCEVWYPSRYLCSNEVTHRLECRGCLLRWREYEQVGEEPVSEHP